MLMSGNELDDVENDPEDRFDPETYYGEESHVMSIVAVLLFCLVVTLITVALVVRSNT